MKKTEIKITCKDCLFYDGLVHPTNNFVCKLGGVLGYADPCQNFCIDMKNQSIINNENPEFLQFIRQVPTSRLSELAALLVQEGHNREQGWSIGDIAYYCLGKTECVSSYVQVVFKGIAGNMDLAIIEGVQNEGKTWIGIVEKKCLVKGSEWPEKHKKLVADGKISDDGLSKVVPGYSYPEGMDEVGYIPQDIANVLKQVKDQDE